MKVSFFPMAEVLTTICNSNINHNLEKGVRRLVDLQFPIKNHAEFFLHLNQIPIRNFVLRHILPKAIVRGLLRMSLLARI